jgi:hypothetical protein
MRNRDLGEEGVVRFRSGVVTSKGGGRHVGVRGVEGNVGFKTVPRKCGFNRQLLARR